jgi:hypothetical protein
MTEYVIWGKCGSDQDEQVLVSNAGTMDRAEAAIKTLADKHGCYDMRIQVLDLSQPVEALFLMRK